MRVEGPTSRSAVRRARAEDIPEVSRVLAWAFVDDPMMNWLHPQGGTSMVTRSRLSFELGARYAHHAGEGVDIALDRSGRIAGCAVWLAMHRRPVPPTSVLATRVALWRIYGRRTARATNSAALIWKSQALEPHWHLNTLGVAATARGRGHAHDLMEAGLERSRSMRLPAHLESSRYENVAFYQRYGFEVTGTVDIPDNGPRVWLMRYEP
ncbi:GNAT family N-acetyltransferase [Nocardia jejuensis]|uniref:GNAT family N-acetyltransferase n=1 Tax=Nocardia jejuensis TaxID=328049 RepID=UPI0014710E8C|nr:GNAT family N-acetyltransferase [Nocardia jejuensis]